MENQSRYVEQGWHCEDIALDLAISHVHVLITKSKNKVDLNLEESIVFY